MKNKILMKIIALICVAGLLCVPVYGTDNWESDMDQSGTIAGDMDGNGLVDNKDVEYLLWHTLYPEDFPLPVSGDFDSNNSVDNKDVEYLLWHTLYPEDFPLIIPEPAKTLTINTAEYSTVFVGETLQIDYTYSGSKSELTWLSDDTSILTVNNSGLVTGKSIGSTSVIVTNGNLMKVVPIVVAASNTKANNLKKSNMNAPLYDGMVKYAGDYMSFEVVSKPDNTNPHVVITSTNSSVVSVSYSVDYRSITQVKLNFKSSGTATVKMTSGDGAYSESYKITVKSDYACNPGSGMLTPEQFAYCSTQVLKASGMDVSSVPGGYLELQLSDSELTWNRVLRETIGLFHPWWKAGKRCAVVTYEGKNENGMHVFYQHR